MNESKTPEPSQGRPIEDGGPTRDDLIGYIQGTIPFLEEAWAACFEGKKEKLLSSEQRGMGILIRQFKALAEGKRIIPLDCITTKEANEDRELAIAWAHRKLGNPNEMREDLREWVHAGETCVEGLERANAEVLRLRSEIAARKAVAP